MEYCELFNTFPENSYQCARTIGTKQHLKDVRKSHKLTLEFERRLNIGSLCSIYLQIYRQRINETEGERKRAKMLQRFDSEAIHHNNNDSLFGL